MGGGVQTLISHLINFKLSPEIHYEIIYVVETANLKKIQRIPLLQKVNERVFIYDSKWNFYFTIKKLRKLIPDPSVVLIAHDWLELGMISQLKMKNPVLSFLHGNYEYYYALFLLHRHSVNLFLSVTNALRKKIINHVEYESDSIIHYPFPVPDFEFYEHQYNSLRVLFIANDLNDPNKKFDYLPIIDQQLVSNGLCIEWHIVGSGKSLNDLQISFNATSDRIKYHGYMSNELLRGIYQQANLFINCSDKEGLPVSLVEAMKHGLIPIVNSWDGSANDLIEDSINGFIVVDNRPEEYVNVILKLNALNNSLLSMSKMAFCKATERHSLKNQITKFESMLFDLESIAVNREPRKIYGSRLDSPYIPNCMTKTIRNIMKLSNG